MSGKRETEIFRKLFIGGLNYKSTEETLKSHFERWGEIVGCVVMREPHTMKSRGFGFIIYKNAHMVDDAQAARPHKIDGRELDTRRMRSNASCKYGAELMVYTLFVHGIKDMGEDDLREFFGQYGNIVNINRVTDKRTDRTKDYAFVKFDYDPVDKIVLQRPSCNVRKLHVEKSYTRTQKIYINRMKELCLRRGGYGGGYRGEFGDCYGRVVGWNGGIFCHPNRIPVVPLPGTNGCWVANYGSNYAGGTIPGNTSYEQPGQTTYDGLRPGGYGRK